MIMVYFKKIACAGKYHDDQAIPDVVSYIARPEKAPSRIIYGVRVDMQNIAESMIAVSKSYGKYSRLRLHHFVITFNPKYKAQLDLLVKVMEAICNYIGRTYQIMVIFFDNFAIASFGGTIGKATIFNRHDITINPIMDCSINQIEMMCGNSVKNAICNITRTTITSF